MARTLSVPKRYESGLAKIRDLDEQSIEELLAALRNLPSTYNEGSLSSAAAEMVDTIAASDVKEIVPALLSLYSYQDYSQLTASDVAKGIAQGMEEGRSELLRLPSEDRASFEERLTQLLSVSPLSVTVRAGMLSLENEHTVQETRVLTDIRPVFDPNTSEADLTGAVIAHTLKISYRGDNSTKDFFVTFDAEDISQLIKQLEWARSKAARLKLALETAEVPYIDAE